MFLVFSSAFCLFNVDCVDERYPMKATHSLKSLAEFGCGCVEVGESSEICKETGLTFQFQKGMLHLAHCHQVARGLNCNLSK